MSGSVALIGMGTGEPGGITARALEMIRGAEVVVADGSLDERMWGELVRDDAQVSRVGDADQAWMRADAARAAMIQAARTGQRVARLRLGEGWRESEALRDARVIREAGIALEIVPGLGAESADWKRWMSEHPMYGRTVVITRMREQAGDTAERLRARGAEPWSVPTIEIAEPPEPERLRKAAREVGSWSLVAFTSANGVERFFAALKAEGLDARAMGPCKVASIGPATGRALEQHGIRPDVIAKEFVGEALAEAIVAACRQAGGKRVLIPRALEARESLPDKLREAGLEVLVVPAYETRAVAAETIEPLRRALAAGQVDAVLLTSGSTVKNLCEVLGEGYSEQLRGTLLASIGPVTTKAAKELGLEVGVTAGEYTLPALIEAVERHLVAAGSP